MPTDDVDWRIVGVVVHPITFASSASVLICSLNEERVGDQRVSSMEYFREGFINEMKRGEMAPAKPLT